MALKIILGFLALLFLVLIGVIIYFYRFAFVRKKSKDFDALSVFDGSLKEFEKDILDGIKFNDEHPHEEVFVTSFDKKKLKAKHYKTSQEKIGSIILFHGYRSNALRDFAGALKEYLSLGLDVLLVDQRSHGKSGGRLITFGVKESKDVITWINYLLEKKENEKIFLSGISMGATTVVSSIKHGLPDNVLGIVSDCGFTSPFNIIRRVGQKFFKINGFILMRVLNAFCILFGRFNLNGINTEKIVKTTTTPILFIHGEKDDFVPIEMTKKSFDACVSEKTFISVKDAEHGTSYLVDKEKVTTALKAFVLSKI